MAQWEPIRANLCFPSMKMASKLMMHLDSRVSPKFPSQNIMDLVQSFSREHVTLMSFKETTNTPRCCLEWHWRCVMFADREEGGHQRVALLSTSP